MTQTYTLARKIHRLFMFIILALSLLMGGTGIVLKFPSITTNYLTFIDLAQARYLHNQLSTYFSIILFLMALTGLWMYIYPAIQKQKRDHKNSQHPKDINTLL